MTAAYPGLYESRGGTQSFVSPRQDGNGGKASRSVAELYVRGGKAFPFHQLYLGLSESKRMRKFCVPEYRSELCSSHCLESRQFVYERGGYGPSQ